MEHISKLKHTLDALFGNGVSTHLPKSIKITFSKKNGRIKHVYYNGSLLCTLRIDGGIVLTPFFAQILLRSKKFKENCLEVDKESKSFVEEGKSVFCKHVIWCGKNIRIASETVVLFDEKVIAVGKAVLSSKMIPYMKSGVAVKVRESLKSSKVK